MEAHIQESVDLMGQAVVRICELEARVSELTKQRDALLTLNEIIEDRLRASNANVFRRSNSNGRRLATD